MVKFDSMGQAGKKCCDSNKHCLHLNMTFTMAFLKGFLVNVAPAKYKSANWRVTRMKWKKSIFYMKTKYSGCYTFQKQA